MKDFRVNRIDKYGRNYPVEILLKNGEKLIGHIAIEQHNPEGTHSILLFKVIENLEEWRSNKIQYGTKNISLQDSDIEEIKTYTNY